MDPIADFLTRLRNAGMARKDKLDIPFCSRLLINLASLLKKEGYILNFKVAKNQVHSMMRVYLRYTPQGGPFISKMKRVSRPGKRLYKKSREITEVRSGYGLSVFSTSRGLMSGKAASKAGVGGEWLCELW